MYGLDVQKLGIFGRNCLLARRMAVRDVRFVQIFRRDWNHHSSLPINICRQTKEVEQPAWALVQDLRCRGLQDDTLVIRGRVWPHDLQPWHVDQNKLWPRPAPQVLFDVDGLRPHQSWYDSW